MMSQRALEISSNRQRGGQARREGDVAFCFLPPPAWALWTWPNTQLPRRFSNEKGMRHRPS